MPERRRHILLLQGPMGPFFARLTEELKGLGHEVTRVVFNGGDWLFQRGAGVLPYRGSLEGFERFLGELIEARGIEAIALFGEGRPLHRLAIAEARRRGLEVIVFEEGYLRPDWITFEEGGVNGNSPLPRSPEAYLCARPPEEAVLPVGRTFGRNALFATFYVIAMQLGALFFPRYAHHRPLRPLPEAYRWVRSAARKQRYKWRERGQRERLTGELRGRFFLVPLQVHCDYQLAHSDYATVEAFALEVIAAFAAHAPADTALVLKHHPMDRPYRDYTALFRREAARLGLGERLLYIHDQDLPPLLDASRGVIVMNSTVGLQAIAAGVPTLALGRAIFTLPGLVAGGTLAEFFRAQEPPSAALYEGLRAHLLTHALANGSFAKPLDGVDAPTGVRWPKTAPFGLGAR